MNVTVTLPHQKGTIKKEQSFEVIDRTTLNVDNTMLLRLKPKKKSNFQSGDLLTIIPQEDKKPRQYSIARIENDILLCIKRHSKGLCSNYLSTLKIGDLIPARIEENKKFHFPVNAPSVWLVGNGTGIAPYLGMMPENDTVPIQLLWGGRTKASFDCYHEVLEGTLSRKRIHQYQLAFSQEKDKTYVQDVLINKKEEVAKTLKEGGVFMLCGSVAMQQSVLDVLEEITTVALQKSLRDFENNGQLLMDCY